MVSIDRTLPNALLRTTGPAPAQDDIGIVKRAVRALLGDCRKVSCFVKVAVNARVFLLVRRASLRK